MELQLKALSADGEQLVGEVALRDTNAVIFHGAGKSSRKRYRALAEELLRRGVGVILFDFSGHGDSSGVLTDSSLARRELQARAIMETFAPAEGALYLVGFSMGAQVVCDLLPDYGGRAAAILLGCPAIYANGLRNLVFAAPSFTGGLRRAESWRSSAAPGNLKKYKGRTIIAVGNADEVIPPEVIKTLSDSADNLTLRQYDGVGHQLANWLGDHPKELSELVGTFLAQSNNGEIVKAGLLIFRGQPGQRELMLVRGDKPYFVLPGGKREVGESIEQALEREIREELSCDVSQILKLGRVDGFTPDGRPLKMHLFGAGLIGTPVPSAEIKEVAWMSRAEVMRRAIDMTPMTLENLVPFCDLKALW